MIVYDHIKEIHHIAHNLHIFKCNLILTITYINCTSQHRLILKMNIIAHMNTVTQSRYIIIIRFSEVNSSISSFEKIQIRNH